MSLNLDFISTEFNLKVVSNSESKAYLFEGYRLDVQRRMLYRGEREFVYFVGREKPDHQDALYRISTLGRAAVKILNGVHSPVTVSPDGREVAFVRYNEKKRSLLELVLAFVIR